MTAGRVSLRVPAVGGYVLADVGGGLLVPAWVTGRGVTSLPGGVFKVAGVSVVLAVSQRAAAVSVAVDQHPMVRRAFTAYQAVAGDPSSRVAAEAWNAVKATRREARAEVHRWLDAYGE